MNGIAKAHEKLLLLACAALCSLAAAATAQADDPAPAETLSFCVGGHTESYASDLGTAWDLGAIVSLGGYLRDRSAGDVPASDDESFAQQEENGEAYIYTSSEGAVFVPVSAGACADPGAKLHNHSPLCYSKTSNDLAYFDSGDLADLLSRGYSVPSAVKTDGNWRLVCNPGTSMTRTGTKLGSDKKTIVSDAFAAGNDGWWEILEPNA